MRDYYTKHEKDAVGDQDDLKPKLISCLCQYLGYDNYASFVNQNTAHKPIKAVAQRAITFVKEKRKRRWNISISISIAF